MLKFLYDDDYNICPIVVDCADQGHAGVARTRLYCLLSHKKRVEQIQNPQRLYNRVTRSITSCVETSPQDYFFANLWEILRDAQHVARVRSKRAPIAPD